MQSNRCEFKEVVLSLADFLPDDYLEAVCEAHAFLSGEDVRGLKSMATHPVSFFPVGFQSRLLSLLPKVGQKVCRHPVAASSRGATSRQFELATRTAMAPLSGLGYYRIGEDGRLYLITKSEHYHTPLGHGFPGYGLVERARRLGIPNATHNNTRGAITRLLEQELVAEANGIQAGDPAAMEELLAAADCGHLNRVLNLETGSLAVEAALKMMLARFYRPQGDSPTPKYEGRTPVFIVVGNDEGGLQANYHGTTILTQTMRGMWPEWTDSASEKGLYQVRAVRPNRIEDFRTALAECDKQPYKVAGFFHEIVMMNYGARLLEREYLEQVYALCQGADVPIVVDEIQSCLWARDFYLFRDLGLKPTFVAVGKGLTGGEYAASRILFCAAMDSLPQFGALVTNGQEELASLTYLISMRWAKANAAVTSRIGEFYESRLREIADQHRQCIVGIEGFRHLCSIKFHDMGTAKAFAASLNQKGMDISVQTYKADCPPSVLTKLPLIMGQGEVEWFLDRIQETLKSELSG